MSEPIFHISFYQLSSLPKAGVDAELLSRRLRKLASDLLGAVLVADEGINGMLAGTSAQLDRFEKRLRGEFPIFAAMRFKRTACSVAPFQKLKIHCKREVVQIGRKVNAQLSEAGKAVTREDAARERALAHEIEPQAWSEFCQQSNVIVLDNRNQFEYQLGQFIGAVNPGVHRYQDFADYVEAHLATWQEAGNKIAMYCTGGIRCEKTAQWLAEKGVESFSLKGGIISFLQDAQADRAAWQGECFVFDNRLSLDGSLEQGQATEVQIYTSPDDQWRLDRALRLRNS